MTPDPDVDVVVIGAGVLGLASAARLSRQGRSVLVLERHPGPGRETSSRNSEVLHAGIYYPTGSLKARLCVRGNQLLGEFCEQHAVAYRRLGKVIVATEQRELPALEQLMAVGVANGAPLQQLDRLQLRQLEPNVAAVAGLLSPTTGVLDSHGVIKALEARARAHGALVAYRCEVTHLEPAGEVLRVATHNPSGAEQLVARVVVNAAGLESDTVARMAGVDAYRLRWCKGDYFSVSPRRAGLVSRLVYPVPAASLTGLGVHVTLDLAGRMRLGPDVTYLSTREQDLQVDPAKAARFGAAVNRYLPQIKLEDLEPEMAGIRPKLQGPGEPWQDFVIRREAAAGLPGLINLVGMESPGLTACLAVAEQVERLAAEVL